MQKSLVSKLAPVADPAEGSDRLQTASAAAASDTARAPCCRRAPRRCAAGRCSRHLRDAQVSWNAARVARWPPRSAATPCRPPLHAPWQAVDQPPHLSIFFLRHAAVRQRRCSYPAAAAAAAQPPPAQRLPARRLSSVAAAASPVVAAAAGPDELVITRPDDWHLHVRDGAGLRSVVPHTAATYGRAIIMPNLVRLIYCRLHVSWVVCDAMVGQVLLLSLLNAPSSCQTWCAWHGGLEVHASCGRAAAA